MVNFSALIDAFHFVSVGGDFDNRAYVDLDTGRIHLVSSEIEIEQDLPEDLEESERYLAVPDRNELDLGQQLVMTFVQRKLPNDVQQVAGFFRRKGAYSRLKVLLADRGLLDPWYAFELGETQAALREWCQENGIELDESGTAAP